MSASGESTRTGHWLHPVGLVRGLLARPKLYLAIAAGILAYLMTPSTLPGHPNLVVAWDAAAIVYIAIAFYIFETHDTARIRSLASSEDETRATFFIIVLMAAIASFWSVIGLIGEAKHVEGAVKIIYLALAGVAIVGSWLVVQIVFTLHYAHGFYRAGGTEEKGGLSFPGDDEPDYWDFLYFTTSIGAASQTSDVSITAKGVRRLVTLHAILSFVFNTTVVALAINLAASLL